MALWGDLSLKKNGAPGSPLNAKCVDGVQKFTSSGGWIDDRKSNQSLSVGATQPIISETQEPRGPLGIESTLQTADTTGDQMPRYEPEHRPRRSAAAPTR